MQLEDPRAILCRVEGGPDGVRKVTEDALEFRDHCSGMVVEPELGVAGQKPRRAETREPILEMPRIQED